MPVAELEQLSLNDLLSPELAADPYPFFRRLHEEDPVHWDAGTRGWLVSRFDDICSVISDRRASVHALAPTNNGKQGESLVCDIFHSQMLYLDPPDHPRVRTLFMKAFSRQKLDNHQPRILALVTRLLDAVQDREGMDYINDFAAPVPLNVVSDILGAPLEGRSLLRDQVTALGMLLHGRMLSPEERAYIDQCARLLTEYFSDLLEDRRRNPKDDMISDLARIDREQGDPVSPAEIIANMIFFVIAGLGTTTHMLGAGVLTLLKNPDQWKALCNDRSLAKGVVAELLRFEPPVQMTHRIALEDMEIGGQIIQRGDRITLLFAAANRDPKRFPDPDRFDMRRTPSRTLSFSHGIHTCMGAALASLELEVAFSELARRFPNLRLDGDPVWKPSVHFRQLNALSVNFGKSKSQGCPFHA